MIQPPDRLSLLADPAVARAFASALGTTRLARVVDYHDVIPTTMDRAGELVRAGTPDGTIVVANYQTAGRGRRGRSWGFGPPGSGLHASWCIRTEAARAPLFNVLSVVPLLRALRSLGVSHLSVKWPNDLLLEGRKVAGILAMSALGAGGEHWVILGTGVDVHTREYPTEVRDAVTSLAASGYEIDRLALLARFAPELERLADGAAGETFSEWRANAPMLGRAIRVDDAGVTFEAEALDLDADGALLVRRDGRTERLLAGDVTVRAT